MNSNGKLGAKAQIDFHCLDSENCDGVVKFNLAEICDEDFQAVCPKCHRAYELDGALRDKLTRMMNLVAAIRDAEDILGDSSVAVTVAGAKEVKIPYALFLPPQDLYPAIFSGMFPATTARSTNGNPPFFRRNSK